MSMDKLKVRLVLQGQYMEKGVDFKHSFSPVPHASSFRAMLAIATEKSMLLEHVDISQCFVQGDLIPDDEVMYMYPESARMRRRPKVCLQTESTTVRFSKL